MRIPLLRTAPVLLGVALLACSEPHRYEGPGQDLNARLPEGAAPGVAPVQAWTEAGRLHLDPGAQAFYHLEAPTGARLTLRASGAGAARLDVRARVLEHDTLHAREELVLIDVPPDPQAPPDRRVVAVPPLARGLLQLELGLPAEAPGGVVLEELDFQEAVPAPRPPVILVSIDTLAARNLSLYGYARETTPNLEQFARDAVVFEHCVSDATWTTPSYIALFSGLHNECFRRDASAFKEGGKLPADWKEWVLEESRWTLPEALRSLGYRTGGFIDNLMAGPEFGLAQGFDDYDTQAAEIDIFELDGGMRNIVPRALAWLDGLDRTRPYFLFLQAIDVHAPYLPPPRVAGTFSSDGHGLDPARIDEVMQVNKQFDSIPGIVAQGLDRRGKLPAELPSAQFCDAYDEEVLDLDQALADLWDGLRERGILDEAIVVFTADHGESMLGHGWLFNHGTCYEEVAHIPLVVRPPGGVPGGRRVAQTVQLVDLYPTLLDALGLGNRREDFHGRSLLPLLRGETLPDAPAYIEGGALENRAIYQGKWKLVEVRPARGFKASLASYAPVRAWLAEEYPSDFPDGVPGPNAAVAYVLGRRDTDALTRRIRKAFASPELRLYDLEADPLEEHDLAAAQPERVRRLLELMQKERARVDAARRLIEVREDPEMSPEMLQNFRNLGYAGDG